MTSSKQLGTSTRSRATGRLKKALEKNLAAYIAAASAAGVGMLALAQPAEAKIVYTPAHTLIKVNGGPVELDLNHDGTNDFDFRNSASSSNHTFRLSYLTVEPARYQDGNQIFQSAGDYEAALPKGVKVGSDNLFSSSFVFGMAWRKCTSSNCHSAGPWLKVKQAYLGFKFVISGNIHYGWARIKMGGLGRNDTITGYAYETIANKSIVTGKTHGPDVITVEPATIGHLARGAGAIPTLRRKNASRD